MMKRDTAHLTCEGTGKKMKTLGAKAKTATATKAIYAAHTEKSALLR